MLNIDIAPDYTPSDGEINNLVYFTLKYSAGWPMRQCDLMAIQNMTGPIQGAKGIDTLIHNICEFAWDHIRGEPTEFSADDLYHQIKPMVENYYTNTTVKQRSDIT